MNFCPVCGKKAITSCRCMRGDSHCSDGHSWHTCVKHQKIVIGMSDHSKDINECTCIDSERDKNESP